LTPKQEKKTRILEKILEQTLHIIGFIQQYDMHLFGYLLYPIMPLWASFSIKFVLQTKHNLFWGGIKNMGIIRAIKKEQDYEAAKLPKKGIEVKGGVNLDENSFRQSQNMSSPYWGSLLILAVLTGSMVYKPADFVHPKYTTEIKRG
jgi:hypothetical protein